MRLRRLLTSGCSSEGFWVSLTHWMPNRNYPPDGSCFACTSTVVTLPLISIYFVFQRNVPICLARGSSTGAKLVHLDSHESFYERKALTFRRTEAATPFAICLSPATTKIWGILYNPGTVKFRVNLQS